MLQKKKRSKNPSLAGIRDLKSHLNEDGKFKTQSSILIA